MSVRRRGDGAGRGVQPCPRLTHGFQVPAYRWVSVKVVCSFVTELKPLMAFIRSSSSRYWKEAISLGVVGALLALSSREASRHAHR